MANGSWIRIGAIETNLNARTINSIIKETINRRTSSVTRKPIVRVAIGNELLQLTRPFVPNKSGKLVSSGRATDDGRLYWTAVNRGYNYAEKQYTHQAKKYTIQEEGVDGKPHEPGPYWVDKVTQDPALWQEFTDNITPIIKGNF